MGKLIMEVIKNSGKIFGNTVICKNLGVDYGPMNSTSGKLVTGLVMSYMNRLL